MRVLILVSLLPGILTPADPLSLRNDHMEIQLDPEFPRVLEYRVAGRPKLLGALRERRPVIELNEDRYTPTDFTVTVNRGAAAVDYMMSFPRLKLALQWSFQLDGGELLMKLANVLENGEFRLQSLFLPDHYLLRMPALTPGAMAYRGEYSRKAWKEAVYRGGYGQSVPRLASIAEEDGEAASVRVNWAAMYAPGICATIANNIGYWKLASQFLGFDGRASGFALWNGIYHYRLRGHQQPKLETRIAVLTSDLNGDGKVDWMEAALWHRRFLRAPNPIYAGPTIVYKIINAWGPPPPKNNPVTTFDETLEIVRRIAGLTGGLPQIVYLVGWQFEGHDSGYPSLDKVNPALGGPEKLRWLAREARKYNATISYHINLDDAYREYPGWDPRVLCSGRDGKPYLWMFYTGPGVHLQAYHISHTKEIESGYFEKRAQAFLDAVPVEKSVHLDTFRYSNLSFEPDGYIGMEEELELGCKSIFRWFAARGIDISSEGPYDGFYGTLSYFWHWLSAVHDPFQVVMMHGKAFGGGKPGSPFGELLGWSEDRGFQARPHQFGRVFSPADFSDAYYLGTLVQYYLASKELIYIGPEGDDYVARFADGCMSRRSKEGALSIRAGDLIIAAAQDRFIPLNASEIRLYSAGGGERIWPLPQGWAAARLDLSELRENGPAARNFRVQDGKLCLFMEPRRAYSLRRK